MTPEERAAELVVEMMKDRAIQRGCDDYVLRQVIAAIREAVAEEREACAKTAEEAGSHNGRGTCWQCGDNIGANIRARGETHAEDRNLAR